MIGLFTRCEAPIIFFNVHENTRLVRSRKSSMKRSSQYCGGRPRGNTGCCSFALEWIEVIEKVKEIGETKKACLTRKKDFGNILILK